jgi:hypothetical protein
MKLREDEKTVRRYLVSYGGLSRVLATLAIKRIQEQRAYDNLSDQFYNCDTSRIIMTGMCWGDTPEGHIFWKRVHDGMITDVTSRCYEYRIPDEI